MIEVGYAVMGTIILKGDISVNESNEAIGSLNCALDRNLTTLPVEDGTGILLSAIKEEQDMELFLYNIDEFLTDFEPIITRYDITVYDLNDAYSETRQSD